MLFRYLTTLILVLSYASSTAQVVNSVDKEKNNSEIRIKQTTDAISIDGILNEKTWTSASKTSNLWMSFPTDDRHVTSEFDSEVMIAYDDKNIYVAATCHGGAPYIMPTLKRDNMEIWNGEIFGITLDPLNQKSTAVVFGANTEGVQIDVLVSGGNARRSNNSADLNGSWDQTWTSSATVHADRWVVEFAIPFKSLRFGTETEWGINFWRGVSETGEWHNWTKTNIDLMVVDMSHLGKLIWDKAPNKSNSNIVAVPYVLGSTFKNIQNTQPSEQSFQIGGDAKIAITSSLNLDLTINPDFSQVDVDEQVTNLSTVNIRFPERRLFFLENSDLYSDFGIPPMRPFFSRKIGLDDDGGAIPIAYGA